MYLHQKMTIEIQCIECCDKYLSISVPRSKINILVCYMGLSIKIEYARYIMNDTYLKD